MTGEGIKTAHPMWVRRLDIIGEGLSELIIALTQSNLDFVEIESSLGND